MTNPAVDLVTAKLAALPEPPPPRTIKRTSELLALPRVVLYLIDQLIPITSLCGLWAASNVGKSFLAIDFALHVALGWPWQGRAVRQGCVLYIFGEGAFGMPARVAAWCDAHNVSPDALEDRIVWRDVPLDITARSLRQAVAHELAAMHVTPALIVIDTLAANSPPGFDENSTQDMTGMMRAAGELQQELDTAILLVHHTGLDQTRERGNYAFRAACDVSLQLRTDGVPSAGRTPIRLCIAKARDFAIPVRGIPLLLTASHGAAIIESAPDLSPLTTKAPDGDLQLLESLARGGGQLTFSDWLAASPFGRTKFNILRDALLKRGDIEKPDPDGPYVLTDDGRTRLSEHPPADAMKNAA